MSGRCMECDVRRGLAHHSDCSRYPQQIEREPLIYLSGHVRDGIPRQPDMGWMLTPMMGNNPNLKGAIWAADNGCFSAPEKFDYNAYLTWLGARRYAALNCLFATAPDVVGNAAETIARSMPALHDIRRLGYRAALVAQDGLEDLTVPWDEFDCLFVGGTTAWKLSEAAYALAREADDRGKWVHMGRVNSYRRLKAAAVSCFDSADGTFLAFGPDKNWDRLMNWMRTLRTQGQLVGEAS